MYGNTIKIGDVRVTFNDPEVNWEESNDSPIYAVLDVFSDMSIEDWGNAILEQ